MSDSRIDRSSSRAAPSARSCSPTSSSRPAPAPARRRCSPSGWPPAWPTACTRSSTWRPSRSRARPRPSCAAASTWRSKPGWCPRARPRRRTRRSGALQAALSNLERFFAGTIHSFCARLLRERPVESGVSPGFTELDEVQDLELRQRAWREFITSARAAGDPDDAGAARGRRPAEGSRRGVRDGLRQRRRGVPAGGRRVSGPEGRVEGARQVLEGAAEAPAGVDRRRHHLRDSAGGAAVPRAAARGAASGSIDRRSSRRCSRRGTASPRSRRSGGRTIGGREEAICADLIDAAARATFARDVVEPYLAQWRQYVYRLSVAPADPRARATPRTSVVG